MATQSWQIDGDWVNFTTTASLVNGVTYTLQNSSTTQVYIFEGAVPPAASEDGLVLSHLESALLKQDVDPIYLKTSKEPSKVVTNEAD